VEKEVWNGRKVVRKILRCNFKVNNIYQLILMAYIYIYHFYLLHCRVQYKFLITVFTDSLASLCTTVTLHFGSKRRHKEVNGGWEGGAGEWVKGRENFT
jgi:hypothetical protein